MAQVIHLETAAESPLSRLVMRSVGLAPDWRLEGIFCARFESPPIYAQPRVVATRRSGELRVVQLVEGPAPDSPSKQDQIRAVLDAAVVCSALGRRGRTLRDAVTWLVYDDRRRVEFHASSLVLQHLLRRTMEYVEAADFGEVSTLKAASIITSSDWLEFQRSAYCDKTTRAAFTVRVARS